MKKIMITLGLATALLAGCNGDGAAPQQTGTQNTVGKNATPNMVAQSASVAQVSGQITIESGGYNITFTPTDPQNESIYASIQYGFTGTTATNYANAESSFLVPHRKYNVTITNSDGTPVSHDLQFRFAYAGSLAPIVASTVPPVFAKIMQDNGVLTLINGTLNHNQNFNFIYNSTGGNTTYSAIITPFFAGALNILDVNGNLVASANVGKLINPIFENSYNAPRPLIGGSSNYKFQIDNRGPSIANTGGPSLDLDILYAEGRYLSIDMLSSTVSSNQETVSFLSPKYQGFSTTLPLPILFGVVSTNRPVDNRACNGSVFYTNNDNADITIYGNSFDYNEYTPALDSLGPDEYSSAYCTSHGDGQRYDVGIVSNYSANNSDSNTYAVAIEWWDINPELDDPEK